MNFLNREFHVSRILAGISYFDIDGIVYVLRSATPQERYFAAKIYKEEFEKGVSRELLDEDGLYQFLIDKGLWEKKKEDELSTMDSNIDKLKVALYENFDKPYEFKKALKTLEVTREAQSKLMQEKHEYDSYSALAVASMARTRYLIGKCLMNEDGVTPVWPNNEYENDTSSLLDEATAKYMELRLTDTDYRELARNEPWRSVWACKNVSESIFGKPASYLTEEQKNLIVWSRIYDNAFESPDCPKEAILNHDDAFDGWMIVKRQERENGVIEKNRIRDNDENFIMNTAPGEERSTFSDEDMGDIERMHDDWNAAMKKRRLDLIQKKGSVQEAHMPDSKQEILFNLAKKQSQRS